MRRKRNLSLHPKYILGICTLLCFILMIVSFKFSDKIGPVKSAVGTVLTPMQKGINTVGDFIASRFDNFANVKKVMAENKTLKDQVDTISYKNKLLMQDQTELEELRKLYELDSKYPDYPKVAARIIAKDPSNWYNSFYIDKGSNDGMKVNMNVIAGDGLVGIITKVGQNYSIVGSIIDDNRNVSGMFSETKDNCVVTGDLTLLDEGYIRLGYVENKDAKLKDGYEVVTSQISTKYLPGILIGYATNVKLDSNNLQQSGYLTPAVDFRHLDTVLVITKIKEKLK